MSYSELRANDMRVEREIARFLDSHVYNKESLFLNPRRTDTLDWQFKGCDIIVDVPSLGLQNVIVDEKTQGHYLLRPLPTFALELSFLNKNNELMGRVVHRQVQGNTVLYVLVDNCIGR